MPNVAELGTEKRHQTDVLNQLVFAPKLRPHRMGGNSKPCFPAFWPGHLDSAVSLAVPLLAV